MTNKLLRYVPRRLLSHVMDFFRDSDGYWVWFDDFVDVKYDPLQPCSTIHEDTIRQVILRFRECIILPSKRS